MTEHMQPSQPGSIETYLYTQDEISPETLRRALNDHFQSSGDFYRWMSSELDIPLLEMGDMLALQARFDLISYVEGSKYKCAALDDGSHIKVIGIDPFDLDRRAWATTRTGSTQFCLVSDQTFDAWLSHCEAGVSALDSVTTGLTEGAGSNTEVEMLSLLHIGAGNSAAVRFVNSTLFDALRTGTSDIHIECSANGLIVKFRIDGVLTQQSIVESTELANQAISRIKVMAQLDIAERRVPQDGRLQIGFEGRNIDVRVSIMPSIHGEDAVLRILDRQHLATSISGLRLANLGFNSEAIKAVLRWSKKSHGMLLVTGPTGSGKTTTLYAAIAETHNLRDKMITIEDPVEYQLPGILQIPVNEKKGLTFARGLRSILRHDPDKILVGEIRDSETAEIAIQSALTGHQVFTTVHANNVFDVVGRFSQFGIDPYTFSAALNGIVAQRLLRKVCSACGTLSNDASDRPDPDEYPAEHLSTGVWMRAIGCEACRGTGYSGRFALGETLEFTPAIKALIASRAPQLALQDEAVKSGWISLRALAINAAARGLTTMEEVNRVAS